jgi:hypothetical protein
VQELEQALRVAILETAGLNEIAFQGTVHGYVNTGPSVNAQYQPVTSVIQKKQKVWEKASSSVRDAAPDSRGHRRLEALGPGVVNASVNKKNGSDGEVVKLSGKDIAGLRESPSRGRACCRRTTWPLRSLRCRRRAGLQSIYTTLEKLGEDFPDDEIARIRMENTDPSLKGQAVAEQTRANASMVSAQANAQRMVCRRRLVTAPPDLYGGSAQTAPNPADVNAEQSLVHQSSVGQRLRELARNAAMQRQVDNTGNEPVIGGR